MKTYKVVVRRIVREDTEVTVRAESKNMAIDLAIDKATIINPEEWDCYDCDYLCEEEDVRE